MADREKVMHDLEHVIVFLDARSNMATPGSDGQMLLTGWTNSVRTALALLKEQEPRVMSLKEVETSKGFVWVEFHSINENRLSLEYVNVRATEHFLDSFILTTDSGIQWLRNRGDYSRGIWFGINSGWRCWTERPTERQREETKWDEE